LLDCRFCVWRRGAAPGRGAHRRGECRLAAYALACFIGPAGLACGPVALLGSVGVVLVTGVSFNVTRERGLDEPLRHKRRASDRALVLVPGRVDRRDLRGLAPAALARAVGISAALITSGALIALTGVMVARSRIDGATGPGSIV
jgi:hypothetical protein